MRISLRIPENENTITGPTPGTARFNMKTNYILMNNRKDYEI